VLGLLLAALSRWLAARGGRRRRQTAERRLRAAVEEVGRDKLVSPVQVVLTRHRATREALERAVR
jgi:hypothetical protein